MTNREYHEAGRIQITAGAAAGRDLIIMSTDNDRIMGVDTYAVVEGLGHVRISWATLARGSAVLNSVEYCWEPARGALLDLIEKTDAAKAARLRKDKKTVLTVTLSEDQKRQIAEIGKSMFHPVSASPAVDMPEMDMSAYDDFHNPQD